METYKVWVNNTGRKWKPMEIAIDELQQVVLYPQIRFMPFYDVPSYMPLASAAEAFQTACHIVKSHNKKNPEYTADYPALELKMDAVFQGKKAAIAMQVDGSEDLHFCCKCKLPLFKDSKGEEYCLIDINDCVTVVENNGTQVKYEMSEMQRPDTRLPGFERSSVNYGEALTTPAQFGTGASDGPYKT